MKAIRDFINHTLRSELTLQIYTTLILLQQIT